MSTSHTQKDQSCQKQGEPWSVAWWRKEVSYRALSVGSPEPRPSMTCSLLAWICDFARDSMTTDNFHFQVTWLLWGASPLGFTRPESWWQLPEDYSLRFLAPCCLSAGCHHQLLQVTHCPLHGSHGEVLLPPHISVTTSANSQRKHWCL